jgi:hypothetical protein
MMFVLTAAVGPQGYFLDCIVTGGQSTLGNASVNGNPSPAELFAHALSQLC